MGSNAQKTPLARSLNQIAIDRARQKIVQLGKSLPCRVVAVSGSIVTVSFEVSAAPAILNNVTIPMFGPEYIRYPTQVGDLGVAFTADAYIGGVSGLGGGVASLGMIANLSALVFFPIASTNWSQSENPNAVVIYGPDGTIIRDTGKQTKVQVDGSGNVQIFGARSFSTDAGGYGTRTTNLGGGEILVEEWTGGVTPTIIQYPYNPPEIPSP